MIYSTPRRQKASFYSESGIAMLKTPDVLRIYCENRLGAPKREGSTLIFPCPYGTHERPKLKLSEKNGVGYARCFACGKGGSVLDIAAAHCDLDIRRDFKRIVEHVAEVTGYHLHPESAPSHKKPSSAYLGRIGGMAQASQLGEAVGRGILSSHSIQKEEIEITLPDTAQKAAWEAVARASQHLDIIHARAAELALPPAALESHLYAHEPAGGLLGIDARGALLYLYTVQDSAGAWRFSSVKRRALPHEISSGRPRFTAWKGSKKSTLWGASHIDATLRRVIITEGESDALALRYSLQRWLEMLSTESPEQCPESDDIPLILAKPDAGKFRPMWANALSGLDVILCVDDDEAGREAATSSAQAILAASAVRVFLWTAQGEAKDPRAAYDVGVAHTLIEDVLLNKIPFKQ